MKKILQIIRNLSVYRFFHFVSVSWYDIIRFNRYSSMSLDKPEKVLTKIITTYHVIEKGLSFPNTRCGFGEEKVLLLIKLLKQYLSIGGNVNNSQYVVGVKVLMSYQMYHNTISDKSNKLNDLLGKITIFLDSVSDDIKLCEMYVGGTRKYNKATYLQFSHGDFVEMSQNRCSIRSYSGEDVDVNKIEEAVKLAQKSPSTCNRQTARVYVVKDKNLIKEILLLHGGTRGFGHNISCLIIIAGDLEACLSGTDRNQVYIDSALFAMNVIYAIQYKGYGACFLHWAVAKKTDKMMRELVGIDECHTISCLLAVGCLMDEFEVPFSQRKSLDEILTIV